MEFLTVSTIHLTGLVGTGVTVTGIVLIAAAASLIGKVFKKNRKNRLQQLQKQLDKRLPVETVKEKENQVNSDRQEFIRNERKKYQDWLNNGRPSEKPTTEGVIILSEPEHEIVPVPEDNKVLSKEIEPPLVATVKSEDVLPRTEEEPPEKINDEMHPGSLLLTNQNENSNDSTVRPVLIGDLLVSPEESHDSDAEPYLQTVQADTEESLQPQDSQSNMINLALLPSKDMKSLMDAQPLPVTIDEKPPDNQPIGETPVEPVFSETVNKEPTDKTLPEVTPVAIVDLRKEESPPNTEEADFKNIPLSAKSLDFVLSKKRSNEDLTPEPILMSEDVLEKEQNALAVSKALIPQVEAQKVVTESAVQELKDSDSLDFDERPIPKSPVFVGTNEPYEGEVEQMSSQKWIDVEPEKTDFPVNQKTSEIDSHSLDLEQRPTPEPFFIVPVDNFQKGPVERMVKDAWVEVDTSPPLSPLNAVESPLLSELVNLTKPTPMALVTVALAVKVPERVESSAEDALAAGRKPTLLASEQPMLSDPQKAVQLIRKPEPAPEKVKPPESTPALVSDILPRSVNVTELNFMLKASEQPLLSALQSKVATKENRLPVLVTQDVLESKESSSPKHLREQTREMDADTNSLDLDQAPIPKEGAVKPVEVTSNNYVEHLTKDQWVEVFPDNKETPILSTPADFAKKSVDRSKPKPALLVRTISVDDTKTLDFDERPIPESPVFVDATEPYEGEVEQIDGQKWNVAEPEKAHIAVNQKISEIDSHSLDLEQRPTPEPLFIVPVDNFHKGPVERIVKDKWLEIDTSPPLSPLNAVESPLLSELVNVTKPTPMALVTVAPAVKVPERVESSAEDALAAGRKPNLLASEQPMLSQPQQKAALEKVKPPESDLQEAKKALLPGESPVRDKQDEANSLDLDESSFPKELAVQPIKVPYNGSVEQLTTTSWVEVFPDRKGEEPVVSTPVGSAGKFVEKLKQQAPSFERAAAKDDTKSLDFDQRPVPENYTVSLANTSYDGEVEQIIAQNWIEVKSSQAEVIVPLISVPIEKQHDFTTSDTDALDLDAKPKTTTPVLVSVDSLFEGPVQRIVRNRWVTVEPNPVLSVPAAYSGITEEPSQKVPTLASTILNHSVERVVENALTSREDSVLRNKEVPILSTPQPKQVRSFPMQKLLENTSETKYYAKSIDSLPNKKAIPTEGQDALAAQKPSKQTGLMDDDTKSLDLDQGPFPKEGAVKPVEVPYHHYVEHLTKDYWEVLSDVSKEVPIVSTPADSAKKSVDRSKPKTLLMRTISVDETKSLDFDERPLPKSPVFVGSSEPFEGEVEQISGQKWIDVEPEDAEDALAAGRKLMFFASEQPVLSNTLLNSLASKPSQKAVELIRKPEAAPEKVKPPESAPALVSDILPGNVNETERKFMLKASEQPLLSAPQLKLAKKENRLPFLVTQYVLESKESSTPKDLREQTRKIDADTNSLDLDQAPIPKEGAVKPVEVTSNNYVEHLTKDQWVEVFPDNKETPIFSTPVDIDKKSTDRSKRKSTLPFTTNSLDFDERPAPKSPVFVGANEPYEGAVEQISGQKWIEVESEEADIAFNQKISENDSPSLHLEQRPKPKPLFISPVDNFAKGPVECMLKDAWVEVDTSPPSSPPSALESPVVSDFVVHGTVNPPESTSSIVPDSLHRYPDKRSSSKESEPEAIVMAKVEEDEEDTKQRHELDEGPFDEIDSDRSFFSPPTSDISAGSSLRQPKAIKRRQYGRSSQTSNLPQLDPPIEGNETWNTGFVEQLTKKGWQPIFY